MLLIVTNKMDFTADFLITKLIKKSLPYFRINSDEIPGLNITANFNENYNSMITLNEGGVIDLKRVKSIWYRRAVRPTYYSSDFSRGENEFINGELKHLFEGVLLGLDARWVNPIDSVYIGERKLYQLKIASQIGFKTPESLVTKSLGQVRGFRKKHNGSIICKPIYHGLLVEQSSTFAIHTNRVKDEDLNNFENTKFPSYFQNEISRDCDVRVTVVGKDIYSVEIEHDISKSPDWREKGLVIRKKNADIPSGLKKMIFKLMKKMNLSFGAIDFIKDIDGNYTFLEINPAGEWAWLENDLGIPITESFLKLFFGNNCE